MEIKLLLLKNESNNENMIMTRMCFCMVNNGMCYCISLNYIPISLTVTALCSYHLLEISDSSNPLKPYAFNIAKDKSNLVLYNLLWCIKCRYFVRAERLSRHTGKDV